MCSFTSRFGSSHLVLNSFYGMKLTLFVGSASGQLAHSSHFPLHFCLDLKKIQKEKAMVFSSCADNVGGRGLVGKT